MTALKEPRLVWMSFLGWVFLGQPQHSVPLQDWALAQPSPALNAGAYPGTGRERIGNREKPSDEQEKEAGLGEKR